MRLTEPTSLRTAKFACRGNSIFWQKYILSNRHPRAVDPMLLPNTVQYLSDSSDRMRQNPQRIT
jgi:hypothetical protein